MQPPPPALHLLLYTMHVIAIVVAWLHGYGSAQARAETAAT